MNHSSNNGNYIAQFFLGIIFYENKYVPRNINKAIYYLTLSSNKLNSKAQLLLGYIYYNGNYVPRDIKKAIYYFKKSSSFDNCCAKNNLGVIYKNGDGVEKNIYFAIEYFEEAIRKNNDLFSMLSLFRIYYFGIDVEPNIKKSLELFDKISKSNLSFLTLFLSFTTVNEEYYSLNENKNIINQNLFSEIADVNSNLKKYIDLAYHLIKDFDFVYSDDPRIFNSFLEKLIKLAFNIQTNKKDLRKDINNDFYEGFEA